MYVARYSFTRVTEWNVWQSRGFVLKFNSVGNLTNSQEVHTNLSIGRELKLAKNWLVGILGFDASQQQRMMETKQRTKQSKKKYNYVQSGQRRWSQLTASGAFLRLRQSAIGEHRRYAKSCRMRRPSTSLILLDSSSSSPSNSTSQFFPFRLISLAG